MQRDPHGNVQVSMIETERLLMESVSIELKKRKEKGLFSGNFNPVDHFFGYEGRAGMPSPFDANYCYALGTTAAMLVADKCNGYMSFVEGLQRPIREWSVGGIPIVSLMRLEERKGKVKPVIKKALVDLDSIPFQYFCSQRDGWKYEDVYLFPGPIQFFGEEEIVMLRPRSLMLRFSSVNS
jgi:pyrophosphate--fructose-6-phosphate 1-phosphotransferase